MSVTINDVLLEHSCAHLVVYCLWLHLYCNIRSEKLLQRLKYLLSGPLQQNVCWHLLQRVSALNHVPHSLFSLSYLSFYFPTSPLPLGKKKKEGAADCIQSERVLNLIMLDFLCCCCCCFGPWKLGGLTKNGRKGHRDFLNAGGTALSPSCCFTLQSTLERQVWSRLSVSVIESQLEPGSVLHALRTCSPHSSSPRQGHCPCFVGAEVETQRH